MSKQKTIGFNPLEEYLALGAEFTQNSQDTSSEEKLVKKQRITIHVPIDIIERVKNVVYWQPGLTLAAFAEEAFTQALIKVEEEYGGQYPPRKHPLKGGRPLK